jgi:hypothetical protein
MMIAFILTMPNVGSWDGKWTGEADLHAWVMNYTKKYGTSKAAKGKIEPLLKKKNFYYGFGDGWDANIEVKTVTASGAAKIRKKTKGFCGYDWMIDSILQCGEILNDKQRREREGL